MMPNIDPATTSANLGAATPATPQIRRPEMDKALEAYQTAPQPATGASPYEAGEAQKTGAVDRMRDPKKSATQILAAKLTDQAEIGFQMTREEREVFLNAMSRQESPQDMTEEEQTTLQKVSERIEKMIEDSSTRNQEKLDRLDKAIKEWYNRLAGGKHKAPADLVRLIQQAAAGNLNFTDYSDFA